ncbi:two-component response regulator-like APRR7 isoform X1 [Nicotiana tabacum]|uniref:Two-component response regulator-like APRR7 isoform X1 n=3 Tax=Nicotiana TaxID=4085 RepID=A0AC58UL90_TOBAC|nr:PREDICTED: two-component response regulator-like APRR7 isoform X1 [Nicotiana sylvestris]XP_016491670.1 PREDICTED: two-component response regulator-like APRR7 isoform X2 [Nicotiana tabacum]
MTIVGDEEREMPDEDKVIGDGISHERLNVVQDNKINTNTTNSDRIDVRGNTLQAQGGLKLQQQQQSQGSVVCWEQFLHVTSIKVLLVENDDSTRHVVSALLRNCNYEVIEAANGLQAWKILENLTYHIDLVLTEVVMPCLSGLGLLCKIMSHYAHKTIPVIMMSSHDSMGLVFKCLSKGAVDFLVKPIRKNELKNLWQHVWRRCHSSSGSGSESGTQTQKSIKSKSKKSENNSGSNDGEDNGSDDLNVGNGSDDGSGTQSSWTKQAVEVDSSQAVPPRNLLPECSDSTCAQVLHSNAETAANRSAHITTKRKWQVGEEKPDYIAKGKPSLIGIPRNQKSQSENAIQIPSKLVGAKQNSLLEIDSNSSSFKMDKYQANLDRNCPSTEYHDVTAETSHHRSDSRELNKAVLESNNASINESKQPLLELSLKRLRGPKEPGKTAQDDRNVLRRSDLSAFSRYNLSSNPMTTPHGITLSSSLIDNSQEVAKKEPVCDIPTQTNEKLQHPTSNGTGNNIDMGSTTNKLPKELLLSIDKSEATSTINDLQPSSAFKPVKIDFRISPQQGQQVKPCNMQATTSLAPQGSHTDILIQQPHQHHRDHHVNDLDQRCTSNHVDCSLKKLAVGGRSCASSNILTRPYEGNPEYQSLNRSASGSNRGSNAQDGSYTAINAGGTNAESDNGLAGKNGSGDASGSGCGSTIDPSKLTRAAALTKFHWKKKERCFKKKCEVFLNPKYKDTSEEVKEGKGS